MLLQQLSLLRLQRHLFSHGFVVGFGFLQYTPDLRLQLNDIKLKLLDFGIRFTHRRTHLLDLVHAEILLLHFSEHPLLPTEFHVLGIIDEVIDLHVLVLQLRLQSNHLVVVGEDLLLRQQLLLVVGLHLQLHVHNLHLRLRQLLPNFGELITLLIELLELLRLQNIDLVILILHVNSISNHNEKILIFLHLLSQLVS